MPRLTGSQTGTSQSDLFAGDVQIVDLTANTREGGIVSAIIDGLDGNDGIQGIVSLTAASDISVTARAIDFSTITDSGFDDDSFAATATATGFNGLGRAFGYGVYAGSIEGGNGDDSFNLSGTAKSANVMKGVGVAFTTIDGGGFNDTISISGSAFTNLSGPSSATAYGTEGAVVRGGSGKDTIEIDVIAKTGADGSRATANAIGVKNDWVLGDGDDDRISVSVNSKGETKAFAKGALNANVYGGDGFDNIALTATSDGFGGDGWAAGIDGSTVVFGGNSGDVIGIKGVANGGDRTSGDGRAFGVRTASVFGGEGNDAMFITAEATGISRARAYGIFKSKDNVTGGTGDDRIIVSATATETTGRGRAMAYGLYESDVFGAEGNDQIVVTSTTRSASGKGGVGAFKSQIVGGAGNDSIQVKALERAAFDIQDSLIFGGDGDDKLDVGMGSGEIKGGAGNDLAILDYFNADTMTIAAVGGAVRVSGTQTKSGFNKSWSQDIFDVESFQVGESVYTAETLVSTFSA